MKMDDAVLFYHSGDEKAVVGIARVVKEYYPDPTTEDDRWVVVDLMPVEKLSKPVTLRQIKEDTRLAEIPLVRIPRLSVQPLSSEAYDIILAMSTNA
jgi:predicted RNA-binding protein with PUA-like domain